MYDDEQLTSQQTSMSIMSTSRSTSLRPRFPEQSLFLTLRGNCGLFLSDGMDKMKQTKRRRKRTAGETEEGKSIPRY